MGDFLLRIVSIFQALVPNANYANCFFVLSVGMLNDNASCERAKVIQDKT